MNRSGATPAARLLVIRHGQSEWNAQGRWQGTADPPLTDAGMLQASQAAAALGTFDAIWCSHLQRAAVTARIIGESLGIGPVLVDPRLREAHYGPWQGLTAAEVEAGWPGYLAQHRRPPEAEQPVAIIERVSACMRDIAAATPGEVLVIAHAGVIRTMRQGLGHSNVRFANLSGCWFHVDHMGDIAVGPDVSLVQSAAPISEAL
jgi:probable phosphoglycerate mutase